MINGSSKVCFAILSMRSGLKGERNLRGLSSSGLKRGIEKVLSFSFPLDFVVLSSSSVFSTEDSESDSSGFLSRGAYNILSPAISPSNRHPP